MGIVDTVNVKDSYNEMYRDDSTRIIKLPFLYRKLRRFEVNRYDLTYQLAPGGEALLDIGCGNGDLLLRLRDKYQEVWGVDATKPRIEQIQKRIGNWSFSSEN